MVGLLESRSSRLCGLLVAVLSHGPGRAQWWSACLAGGLASVPSRREQVLQRANAVPRSEFCGRKELGRGAIVRWGHSGPPWLQWKHLLALGASPRRIRLKKAWLTLINCSLFRVGDRVSVLEVLI